MTNTNQSSKLSAPQKANTNQSSKLVATKNEPNNAASELFAFQNMLVIDTKAVSKYMSNNLVRVAVYKPEQQGLPADLKGSYGLIDNKANPFVVSTGLLESQEPREDKLAFIAEEFGLKTNSPIYSKETFNFSALGKLLLNKTKAVRTLTGFSAVSEALSPKPMKDQKGPVPPMYTGESDQKLPGTDLPLVPMGPTSLRGRIQIMNSTVYDSLTLRQEFFSGIPDSILETCFKPAKENLTIGFTKTKYNPLNNDVLNLGKNLFDFESLVHVGYLSKEDVDAWQSSVARFLSKRGIDPLNFDSSAPNAEDVFRIFPKFQNVWASSIHQLSLDFPGSRNANIKKGSDKRKEDAKTVQYALYTNNHVTRFLELSATSETGKTITSFFPYIRSFESPSRLCNMSKKDLEDFKAKLESSASQNQRLPKSIQESITYYRYVNQTPAFIGENVDVTELVSGGISALHDKMNKKVNTLTQKSNQSKGFEMGQGGSFAQNIFEKNARLLSADKSKKARVDALNFVADDNSKFIDVRLPPAFYKKNGALVRFPVDYAMAYSTNSNVVLVSKTIQDGELNTFNVKEDFSAIWDALNRSDDFSASRTTYPGAVGEYADKVEIKRTKYTPFRMLADMHYRLHSNYGDKVFFEWKTSMAENRMKYIDRQDIYVQAIHQALLDPKRDLFYTPFKTKAEQAKFKSFMNVLRGVLFDISSFYKDGKVKEALTQKNMSAKSDGFRAMAGTKEFIPGLNSTDPSDPEKLPGTKDFKKDPKGNKITKDFFYDSAIYSNTVKDDSLAPRFEPLATGATAKRKYREMSLWPSGTTSTVREYTRAFLTRTHNTVNARKSADSNSQHNLFALLPFIQDGHKKLTDIKKNKAIEVLGIRPPSVFDVGQDLEKTLDCLYFYHAAATNSGALMGYLDKGELVDKHSVEIKPFLINPYSGTYTVSKEIIEQAGLSGKIVRSFETFVELRKEYYGQRFLALIGSLYSDIFSTKASLDFKVEPENNQIVFEKVFAKMARWFIRYFSEKTQNSNALTYFEKQFNLKEAKSDIDIGKAFQKTVFYETTGFEILIKKLLGESNLYKYADSPFEINRKYFTDPELQKEADAKFKKPFVLTVSLDAIKYSGDRTKPEAIEKAKMYYCSLDKFGRQDLEIAALQKSDDEMRVVLAMITPGLGIPTEWQEWLCKGGDGRDPKELPMPSIGDEQKFLTHLANVWTQSGGTASNILEMTCSKLGGQARPKVTYDDAIKPQLEKEKALIDKDTSQAMRNELDALKKDLEAEKDQKKQKDNKLAIIGASVAGVSILGYLGYKAFVASKKGGI